MTTVAPHRHSESHAHTHGPACGHQAVIHLDHVDYLPFVLAVCVPVMQVVYVI